jgi:hypothetical protein
MSLGESTTNSAPLSFLRRGGGVAGQKGRSEDYVRTVVHNKGLVFTDITHILLLFCVHMRARLLGTSHFELLMFPFLYVNRGAEPSALPILPFQISLSLLALQSAAATTADLQHQVARCCPCRRGRRRYWS